MMTHIAKEELTAYEIGYLLTPLVPEEQVAATVERVIVGALTAAGATVGVQTGPKLIPLAYRIKKMIDNRHQTFSEAYFGSIRFIASPEAGAAIGATLGRVPELVRSLLVVIPAGETEGQTARRQSREEGSRAEPVTESAAIDEVAAPVTAPSAAEQREAIDKGIDDLLTPATV